jgi:hypothetical protein
MDSLTFSVFWTLRTHWRFTFPQTKLPDRNEQIRHLLGLIRRRYLRRNQHLQQSGGSTNASRDGDERFSDERTLLCQRVKTVTHVVELLNFVQDRIRMHGVRGFLRKPINKERKLQMG